MTHKPPEEGGELVSMDGKQRRMPGQERKRHKPIEEAILKLKALRRRQKRLKSALEDARDRLLFLIDNKKLPAYEVEGFKGVPTSRRSVEIDAPPDRVAAWEHDHREELDELFGLEDEE